MKLPVVRCCGLAAEPLAEDRATTMASRFKALGDPVRLRLMSLIASGTAELKALL